MNIDFSLPYGTIWNVIVLAFIFLWMFFWLITVIFMGRIRYVKFREEKAYNDIYTQLVSFIQQCTSTLQQGQEKSSLLFSKNGVSISNNYQMRAVRRLLLSYYELFKGDYRAQIVNIIKVNHLQ
ncbi:hypothetical protein HP439_19030, partial [Sphingobacterium shayense]|uniref:hypothetical protein n=1 Tax=Sphingobacterium shayense TaxID=626343 RepID=UPI0015523D44